MNEMGTLLLWCAIQPTLNMLIGAVVYLSVRRFGPATGAWAAASTLLVLCGATAAAFSPWPRWWSGRANHADVAFEEMKSVEARSDRAPDGNPEADRSAAKATADHAAAMIPMIDLAREILKQGKLTNDGHEVRYGSALDIDAAEAAVSVVMPAIVAARESARRAQAVNNMRGIMIAMLNYYDVNGHYPPPVAVGPDGKTPHSWRVEILPYLEQQELYKQYRMEEPWDSDNNKKVLAQMPAFFRDPQADLTKSETSYFALAGSATGLGPKEGKGTKIPEITDGTSNTIAIVEAKRPVPWTKPADIDYDPAKPLPRFGGWHPGGFWAAFCDGSVRFLPANLDQQVLHALSTKAGGEVITNP